MGKRITPPRLRTMIRRYCNITSTAVEVNILFENESPPEVTGERGGYFTLKGERVRFPGAYGRKAYRAMQYRRSTLRIVVGDEWIRLNMGVDVYSLGALADD